MISPEWVRLMARYNAWQNAGLYAAAAGLPDEARRLDRGAFFGSIHATLNHILWADEMWMSRFTDVPKPGVGIPGSVSRYPEFESLRAARATFDTTMLEWADRLTPSDLEGDLTWFSGTAQREIIRPRWVLVTHLFNHQTHHRGQVHAMLTAAGARPEDTDVPRMPLSA